MVNNYNNNANVQFHDLEGGDKRVTFNDSLIKITFVVSNNLVTNVLIQLGPDDNILFAVIIRSKDGQLQLAEMTRNIITELDQNINQFSIPLPGPFEGLDEPPLVEFRLANTSIEQASFRLPEIKKVINGLVTVETPSFLVEFKAVEQVFHIKTVMGVEEVLFEPICLH